MKIFLRYAFIVFGLCAMANRLSAQTDVLTQHNDLERTGWNSKETQLKVSNVSNTTFGLLFKQQVDDQIYAQPLLVSGVSIGGGSPKNVVYVATTNNSIYAIDGDNGAAGIYWQINLTPTGMRPPRNSDIVGSACGGYSDFSANMGIVGTPVIDKAANTLYVVSRYADPSKVIGNGSPAGFHEVLYAIDLSDGHTVNSTEITAIVTGTSSDNVGGKITFNPLKQNQRGGLLLLNGVVYIAFAAHCDLNNYHGWLIGYNASDLNQIAVYITSPNDGRGGIWMSGAAPAAETAGNGTIYLTTGNSNNGNPSVLENRGESILKLVPDAPGTAQTKLTIADWFTPTNYATLNSGDLDFGTQVLLVPNTNLLVTGCKDEYMYVLDKTNLGRYNTTANNILQKSFIGINAGFHASLAYFGGATHKLVYQFAENQILSAYPVIAGSPGSIDFDNSMNGSVKGGNGRSGSYMSVSSNGTDESTGILWISNAINCDANNGVCPGVLYAVNASDVSKTLWTSKDNPGDGIGNFAKTACPTIANGKVYMATFSNNLNVYGLLASNPRCLTNVALNKTAVASSKTGTAKKAFDGDAGSSWTSSSPDPQDIYVDLGAPYDICKVSINWVPGAVGTDYDLDVTDVDPVANPTSWVNVTHVTGNTLTNTDLADAFTGRFVRMKGLSQLSPGSGYGINEMQVFGQPATTCIAPTGLTKSAVTQNTAHISWNTVPGAIGYNLAYQNSSIDSWIYRNNLITNSIDLSALSCSNGYAYKVQSICSSGETSAFVDGTSFNTMTCTVPCGALPTRRSNADIGDIGMAGSSCWVNNVYTIKGSGLNIGGMDDQFQYMFFDQTGDQTYTARIVSQDATNPNNKAGILMKESLSNTAPFAFIGVTSSGNAVFIYRSVDGEAATEIDLAGPKAPYFLQLAKTGTTYAGFVSQTGAPGTWQQVGSTLDLNFGATSVNLGFAVTSADQTKLSTAIFDSYDGSTNLPITLVSFTAQNINDEYVSLHWTTAMEENNDHFTIERSNDGVHFETISTVKAVGNSNVNQNYSTSDLSPSNGVNFYRLKQFDIDGRMAEFPVAQVKFGLNALPVVYPNPATNVIHISSGKELVRLARLLSMDGKEIMKTENLAGLQQINLGISILPAGVYMLEYKTDSKTYQQKILKQ